MAVAVQLIGPDVHVGQERLGHVGVEIGGADAGLFRGNVIREPQARTLRHCLKSRICRDPVASR